MPFLIALVLIGAAIGWADEKLQALGIGWKALGAICVGVVMAVSLVGHLLRGPTSDQSRSGASDNDGAELYPAPVRLAKGLRQAVYLRYRDERGLVTERTVVVHEAFGYRPDGAISHLRGFCQMRNGVRTFRRERILAVGTPQDGEVIEDIDVYLLGRPGRPPYAARIPRNPRAASQKTASPWG